MNGRLAMARGAGGRGWIACGASILLHAAAMAAALALLPPVRLPGEVAVLTVELAVAAAPAEPATVAAPLAAPPVAVAEPPPVPAEAPAPKPAPPARPKPVRAAARAVPSVAPSTGTAVAAPPTPAPAAIDPGWRNGFAAWLAQHRRYPDAARREGVEGHATIRVRIAPDGAVTEAEMLAGTGSALLDRAVGELLEAVRGARFPFAPGMTQASIAQTVTLRYALTP